VATTPLNIDVKVKGQQKINKLNQSLGKTANSSTKLGSALKVAAGALAALGVGKLVKGFVDVGKEVESLQLRFKFLFGSAEEGAKAFDVLNTFAARVPFSLGEIAAASGNLAVVSKDAKALNKNLELTANIAAVAGLDFRTAGEQLQRAFSGGAAAADLFRERGVTALLGFKQGATISIEQTIEKFNELFGPGGKFGDAAGEMANTFTGTLSMISDSFRKFQEAVVKSFFGELKTQFGDLDAFLKQNQLQIEIIAGAVGNVLAKSLRASGDAVKWVADNSDTLTKVLAALIALKVAGIIFGMARALQAMVITTTALVALTGPAGWGLILVATGAAAAAYKLTGDALDSLENSMSESVETAKKQAMAFDDSNRELGIMKAALTQATTATEKAIVKYDFYEDTIIKIKNATKRAERATADWEDQMSGNVLYQAYKKLNDEFDLQNEKINLVISTYENFKTTAGNALADVIMGTKRLSDALGEIARQVVHQLISAIIQLGIEMFVIDLLRKKFKQLRGDVASVNSQLKVQLGLQAALAVFSGGTSLFGGFFAQGGRTTANTPIVVGERGPELFVPNTAGNIIPNDEMQMNADSGGGGDIIDVTFNINTIDASDFDTLLTTRQDLIMGLINRGLAERGKRSLIA
jgi:hypothetical protein